MAFLTVRDGTRLFYNDWGSGRPAVLIHGWPVNADMWEYQAGFLARHGFRVVSYDRRGFGRSEQPWDGYDYDTLSDDLATLIGTLGLRDTMLVGFGAGAGEVARYLARHGAAEVSRAVLISSLLPHLLRSDTDPDGVAHGTLNRIMDGLSVDRAHFLASYVRQFYGAGMLKLQITSELLQWTLNTAMMASPKATLDVLRASWTTDFRGDMAAFSMPTLIVHGGADHTVAYAHTAQRVSNSLPAAQLEVYDGAPHGLHFTERDRLNADLLAFGGGSP